MQKRKSDQVDWGPAPEEYFTGRAWFGPMVSEPYGDSAAINVLGVSFEPGARTQWHSHPGGQVLYCVSGLGIVANEQGERVPLAPGDTVEVPAGELHWHGAVPEAPLFHLSITAGGATEWTGRPVTDDEYA